MTVSPKGQIWQELQTHARDMQQHHMRDLFAADPNRASHYTVETAGLTLDYSKNLINKDTMALLQDLASASQLIQRREAMFAGEKINTTEQRAVLHPALRAPQGAKFHLDGENIMPLIQAERTKMQDFCTAIHTGTWRGFRNKPIRTIINIGIGGSDLGPHMVTEALRPYAVESLTTHFVSNVDASHLTQALQRAEPDTTLFLVASKTFTTQETMTNAYSARDWFLHNGGSQKDITKHFIALSTNQSAVTQFGIDPDNMFQFWDWVGGRYSLWSVIGLSIALQIGYDNFEKLLAGAYQMDQHFQQADPTDNMPWLLALIGIWNHNFLGAASHAVLPYDQLLHRLPAYLQQADMESNGKSVTLEGNAVTYSTGPVIFGEAGTNGQHAFYQLIHQGTDLISSDFIAPAISHNELGDHHEKLLANFLAQPEALMRGKTKQEILTELSATNLSPARQHALTPHKMFAGNKPSNLILLECVTPETLGALIALYEHKIFCQGVIWDINSFDQWGVELGKQLANAILPEIAARGEITPAITAHDSSTNAALNRINAFRAKAQKSQTTKN